MDFAVLEEITQDAKLLCGVSHNELQKQLREKGESSQIAEVKSIQLALDIAERETFFLHLKADSFWTCSRNGYKEDDILLCILKSTTEAF